MFIPEQKFHHGLEPEQRLEMVKRYERPDIPSMKVQKLDNLFQHSDLYVARTRVDTYKDIPLYLFSVGPLPELLGKLTVNDPVNSKQLIEYISAALTLIGAAVANIVRSQRKQVLRSINSTLSNEWTISVLTQTPPSLRHLHP